MDLGLFQVGSHYLLKIIGMSCQGREVLDEALQVQSHSRSGSGDRNELINGGIKRNPFHRPVLKDDPVGRRIIHFICLPSYEPTQIQDVGACGQGGLEAVVIISEEGYLISLEEPS